MKKIIIIVFIAAAILLAAFNIKPILKYAQGKFWELIATQLDKEEAERLRKIENGELVVGKDTILIWGNLYELSHFSDGNHLQIVSNDVNGTILEGVIKHKIKGEKLYIVSDEGYAVIDGDNLCRVFLTVDDEEYVSGYTEDTEGNRKYISRKLDSPYIEYLSQYEDFSEDERKIFEKIQT